MHFPVVTNRAAPRQPLSSPPIAKKCGSVKENTTRYYAASILLTLLFFGADLVLPRGATPAIGYCLVLIVAAEVRRATFLVAMTIVCSVLTWVGYFLEPIGAVWWMSVFERAMVMLVIWIAFVLIIRRIKATVALADQTQTLQLTTRELERSNEELSRFASVVAHDLRSPLNTIGLLAQMLDDRRTRIPANERYESLDSIEDEISRMNALIQRLLTYGRVGSGGMQLEACDCAAVLASVQRKLASELHKVSGTVTHDPLPVVDGDATLIAELLQNLIENSLKYRGDAPPHIHVAATRDGDGYQFSVCDNGAGFEPSDATRIFEPFQQASRGHRDHGGIGLGLATCKKIVERHRGRIWADSKPGHGATFYFVLPCSAESAAGAVPTAS